jgi:outer membrane protein assembly factor BamE (lipoprotein component of BamABCDE complex)
VRAPALLALGLLLAGCAALPTPETTLSPGMSSADVEAKMGKPKDTLVDSAGRTVWFYPTAPDEPRRTWAVLFARDGKLEKVEQRLTPANIAKVTPGMTKPQVRELLGPPWKAYQLQRLPYEEWDYRVTTDLDNDLLIRFTSEGVVHEKSLLHDPKYDRGP